MDSGFNDVRKSRTAANTRQRAERENLAIIGTPGRSQMPAKVAKAQMTPVTLTIRFTDSRPCSNGRNTCVNDSRAIHSSRPGWPARVKSKTHEPSVNASVTIAAVAELSEIDAANSAMAPTSKP